MGIRHRSAVGATAALAAAAVLLSACESADPDGPSPFEPGGRLIVATGPADARQLELWELDLDGEASSAAHLVTVPQREAAAAVSPDGTTLARVDSDDGIVLHDLDTGTAVPLEIDEEALGSSPTDCLAWSPDGERLAFRTRDGALFAAGPDEELLVLEQPWSLRYEARQVLRELQGRPVRIRSGAQCGRWLAPGRLVFDRYAGEPPEGFSGHRMEWINDRRAVMLPDTTTMALMEEEPPDLVDSASLWTPLDACGDFVLAEDPAPLRSGLFLLPLPQEEDLDVVGAQAWEDMSVGPGAEPTAAFLPGSCDLVVVTGETDASGDHVVHRTDPRTGQPHPSTPALTGELDAPRLEPGGFAWAPRGEAVLAEVQRVRARGGVAFWDLSSGDGVLVSDVPGLPADVSGILAWLP